jgi:hypothetical protein
MSDNNDEPVDFWQQLRADKTTLETMLEDQREHTKQLTAEAGDPLQLKELRGTTLAVHQTYVIKLEEALEVLESLLN